MWARFAARPIRELALTMDRIRAPEQPVFDAARRDDEIGLLYSSFDGLLNRVRDLLVAQRRGEETKRRLEIKILRNQIKPHFLGNTLACIATLAKQKRAEEHLAALPARLSEHDGCGDVAEEGRYSSIGLRNVADRVRLVYGEDYGLQIESECGKGTRVTVRMAVRRQLGSESIPPANA